MLCPLAWIRKLMRPTPPRNQVAITATIPSPTGGLNAIQPLSSMQPQYASVMTNLYPYADKVGTRYGIATLATQASISAAGGTEGWATMMTNGVTLFGVFNWGENVAGIKRRARICSINTSTGAITTLREITATGTAEDLTSLGEWEGFTSASGTKYLVYCASIGGVFTPQGYDGANWAALAITGVPNNTAGVAAHRNRLWFYNNTTKPLSAYYLPVGAIGGAVTEFNLGPIATRGGTIVSLRTWATDGGTGGADDVAVFYTSMGQVIIYSGTDPSSRATWQLLGAFDVGKPVYAGDQTVVSQWGTQRGGYTTKYGADVLLVAEDGLTSVARVMQQQIGQTDYTISTNIRPLIVSDLALPALGHLSKVTYIQPLRQLFLQVLGSTVLIGAGPTAFQITGSPYAMNAETGAWTKFEWAGSGGGSSLGYKDGVVVGSTLYFNDGLYKIYTYSSSNASVDNSTAFTFECRQAYTDFSSPNIKMATLMQPTWATSNTISITLNADVDFVARTISSYTSYTATTLPRTITPGGIGRSFAAHLAGQTSSGALSWYSTNWVAQPGGVL